jgi:hypothetical protein
MKVALLCLSSLTVSSAFLVSPSISQRSPQTSICRVAAEPEQQLEEGDVLLFSDGDIPDFDAMMDDDSGSDYDEDDDEVEIIRKPHSRWSALNQNARHGMKKEKQDRVIKQRTESKHDKKRREYSSSF